MAIITIFLCLTACDRSPEKEEPLNTDPDSSGATEIVFVDVTEQAGIDFVHRNGALGKRFLPETMGSGVAFFDYDGDERPDLYFVGGNSVDPSLRWPPVSGALYRNRGDGSFEEVTVEAGLDVPLAGMGVAVGDIDNDDDLDLLVSGVGGDLLFRNRGDGTFENATQALGLGGGGFGSSAAFLDFDLDGWLDLFVGRYISWNADTDVACRPDGVHRSYCTPEVYAGAPNQLYRNVDGQRFVDVTRATGAHRADGKTLGVVPVDANGDGRPDLAVANDTTRNVLLINRGQTPAGEPDIPIFGEDGVASGLAYSQSGATRGAMGIDAGDFNGDGRDDLLVGNFSQEMSALYRATEHGLYVDDAATLGLGLPTLMTLAFGTLAADLDGDGWLDAIFANGHIEPEIARFQAIQTYEQPVLAFRNRGSSQGFESVTASGPLSRSWVGRGLASADYDGDGDLDLVLSQNGRAARLWRNDSSTGQAWLRLRLIGTSSNRTGYGAIVEAVAGERRIRRGLVSGRSYLSASEPVLTFGLGDLQRLDTLEITWPSGQRQTLTDPKLGELHIIEEP